MGGGLKKIKVFRNIVGGLRKIKVFRRGIKEHKGIWEGD